MMADPHGKELTIALADQAFRSRRPERIADQLAYLLERYGVPQYMDWWERVALLLGGAMAHYLPSLVVPPIVNRLRHETQNVILPGEEEDLRRYLEERRRAGMRLNLNQLGEAILGEAEAARRLEAYLALLARDDVEYISVKVSSVFSQIDLVAFRATVARVAERLRTLYRAAARHRYRHPDGRITPKFINLDMEEYRDLDLTVTAFREVLDEPEFLPLSAGVVLQAYLPDSHRVQRALTAWARARRARGGAPIKLRIVKGANLAMERIEAAVHGWPQAPYETKAEVDANYKRMLEYGCRPEHAEAVHLGVASHNLFDIAYGLVLREAPRRRAVGRVRDAGGHGQSPGAGGAGARRRLLLYAPVVRAEDFHSAIAYLVRRLDENTAPENFLRHVFDLEPGSPEWVAERDRFLAAFGIKVDALRRAPPDAGPEGRGARRPAGRAPRREVRERSRYRLDPGGQPRVDRGRRRPLARARAGGDPAPDRRRIPPRGAEGEGRDPSRPGRVAYRYALAGPADVDRALTAARAAQPAWAGLADRRARGPARGVRGRAGPAARRPDRRDDPRRRQDGDGGGRRGLRGDRLRALLRPDAARDGRRAERLPHGAARRGGRDAALELPALHSRRAACSPRSRPATPSCSSRRPRRCWSAGGWPAACGTPASRATSSSSCPAPTTRSAEGW